MDVLPSVAQLSMILQKDDLDISCVQPALAGLQVKIQEAKQGKTHYQQTLKGEPGKKRNKDGALTQLKYKGKTLEFGTCMKSTGKEVEEIRNTFCEALSQNIECRFQACLPSRNSRDCP